MPLRLLLVVLVTAILAFSAGQDWARRAQAPEAASRIIRQAEARTSHGDWGSISLYTEDGTATFGTTSLLTAQLEFLPGKRLQPPHQHADEEVQYVISGHGTWTLNGEEVPLQPGDLMYTKPWDWHGIANTGTEPLRFVVFKWKAKGTPPPAP